MFSTGIFKKTFPDCQIIQGISRYNKVRICIMQTELQGAKRLIAERCEGDSRGDRGRTGSAAGAGESFGRTDLKERP